MISPLYKPSRTELEEQQDVPGLSERQGRSKTFAGTVLISIVSRVGVDSKIARNQAYPRAAIDSYS